MDKIEGFLEIGINERHEVVINLDKDRTGHIVFSPNQARLLGNLLLKKADEADGIVPASPSTPPASITGNSVVHLNLDAEKQRSTLTARVDRSKWVEAGHEVEFAVMPLGTKGGRSTVFISGLLAGGFLVFLEVTAANLLTVAATIAHYLESQGEKRASDTLFIATPKQPPPPNVG